MLLIINFVNSIDFNKLNYSRCRKLQLMFWLSWWQFAQKLSNNLNITTQLWNKSNFCWHNLQTIISFFMIFTQNANAILRLFLRFMKKLYFAKTSRNWNIIDKIRINWKLFEKKSYVIWFNCENVKYYCSLMYFRD